MEANNPSYFVHMAGFFACPKCCRHGLVRVLNKDEITATQSEKAVTAYFFSEQLLPSGVKLQIS